MCLGHLPTMTAISWHKDYRILHAWHRVQNMGSSDHVTGTQGQIIYAIRSKTKPCEQLRPFNTEPGVPILWDPKYHFW